MHRSPRLLSSIDGVHHLEAIAGTVYTRGRTLQKGDTNFPDPQTARSRYPIRYPPTTPTSQAYIHYTQFSELNIFSNCAGILLNISRMTTNLQAEEFEGLIPHTEGGSFSCVLVWLDWGTCHGLVWYGAQCEETGPHTRLLPLHYCCVASIRNMCSHNAPHHIL